MTGAHAAGDARARDGLPGLGSASVRLLAAADLLLDRAFRSG
ncbi:hypothetical protein [Actinoplanes sp. RD1]|nr:hypothetical protein [Actinoplanes sp. RD1]